jgi:hypothetical protein
MSARYEMLGLVPKKEKKMTYPIEGSNELKRLVHRLTNRERREPIVVIAAHRHELDPLANAQLLQEELTGMADVYLLAEHVFPHFAKRISNEHHCPVQGGIHLYEPRNDSGIAVRHFECNQPSDWVGITEQLVRHIQQLNLEIHPSIYLPISGHWQRGRGRVEEVLSSTRARVSLDTGGSATMLSVEIKPGISAHQLLAVGQEFDGRFHTGDHHRTFSPFPLHDDVAQRAKAEFAQGSLALAQVRTVSRRKAVLQLHPDLSATLTARPFKNLKRSLHLGDIIEVALSWKGETCTARFPRRRGPAHSLSVIPGGPAWLRQDHGDQVVQPTHVLQALNA